MPWSGWLVGVGFCYGVWRKLLKKDGRGMRGAEPTATPCSPTAPTTQQRAPTWFGSPTANRLFCGPTSSLSSSNWGLLVSCVLKLGLGLGGWGWGESGTDESQMRSAWGVLSAAPCHPYPKPQPPSTPPPTPLPPQSTAAKPLSPSALTPTLTLTCDSSTRMCRHRLLHLFNTWRDSDGFQRRVQ